MLDCTNQLKEPWSTTQKRRVTRLCHSIPENRKEELREELQARAALLDHNPVLLAKALKLLT